MRTASKIDSNQIAIVVALRQMGASVQTLAAVGRGAPDLLVCTASGRLLLVEVKDGDKPPSARRLTPDQARWHSRWNGPVHVVLDAASALDLVASHA